MIVENLGNAEKNSISMYWNSTSWDSAENSLTLYDENGNEITASSGKQANEPVGKIAGDCIRSYFAFKNGVSGCFQSKKDRARGEQTFGMNIIGTEGIVSLLGGAADNLSLYPHQNFNPTNQEQR